MVIKKILVAVNFSNASTRALDIARTLADALGGSLHLLHVIGDPLASAITVEQQQREGCARLNGLLDAEDRERRHAAAACVVGSTPTEITRYAADNAIDLIVMGTHRHGPTFRMATGSIAESVLATAACPVLAVHGVEESSAAAWDPPDVARAQA